MAYLIFIILLGLPIGLYFLFTLKFGAKYDLSIYFWGTVIAVLLITIFGHIYYYTHYDLAIFPSKNYITTFFTGALLSIIIVVFLKFLFRRESGLSLTEFVILFIFLVVLFNWLFPLGYKYYYVKRVDMMEKLLLTGDANNVIQDGDIMIAFVESARDPILRSFRRRPTHTYDNYFFIKNNGSELYRGNIYLTLYNENDNAFGLRLLKEVEVPPNSTQLLIEQENPITKDIWGQRTFSTEQKVKGFEAIIAQ